MYKCRWHLFCWSKRTDSYQTPSSDLWRCPHKNLRIMDQGSIALARDHELKIGVCHIDILSSLDSLKRWIFWFRDTNSVLLTFTKIIWDKARLFFLLCKKPFTRLFLFIFYFLLWKNFLVTHTCAPLTIKWNIRNVIERCPKTGWCWSIFSKQGLVVLLWSLVLFELCGYIIRYISPLKKIWTFSSSCMVGIPVANVYPVVKISQQPLWWIAVILLVWFLFRLYEV